MIPGVPYPGPNVSVHTGRSGESCPALVTCAVNRARGPGRHPRTQGCAALVARPKMPATAPVRPAAARWPALAGIGPAAHGDRLHSDDDVCHHRVRRRDRDPDWHSAGVRPRAGRPPDRDRGPRAVAPRRDHHGGRGRCLGREHQPDARAVRRGRRLPDPAAPDGSGRRAGPGLVPARGQRAGGFAGDAGRGPGAAADRTGGGHGGRGRPGAAPGRRRRHPAAAVPRSQHQAVPGGAHVVPAVADRPVARHRPAAHPGDRQGRARGHRRPPRARAVRHRPSRP